MRPLRQRVVYRDLCEEAQWRLADLCPRGSRNRVQPIVTVGKAAREIVEAAREQHADLIIMGVPNQRGLRRWFRRTAVEKVRRKVSIPVITVGARPRGPRGSLHQGGAASPRVEGDEREFSRDGMVQGGDDRMLVLTPGDANTACAVLPNGRANGLVRSHRGQASLQPAHVYGDEHPAGSDRR